MCQELRDALDRGISRAEFSSMFRRFEAGGVAQADMLACLETLRAGRVEATENRLLRVMDVASGYCAPHLGVWSRSIRSFADSGTNLFGAIRTRPAWRRRRRILALVRQHHPGHMPIRPHQDRAYPLKSRPGATQRHHNGIDPLDRFPDGDKTPRAECRIYTV